MFNLLLLRPGLNLVCSVVGGQAEATGQVGFSVDAPTCLSMIVRTL